MHRLCFDLRKLFVCNLPIVSAARSVRAPVKFNTGNISISSTEHNNFYTLTKKNKGEKSLPGHLWF